MTATVVWPGATAQQMQDEVLNRMEKKFEQLDHFEKVVTFARQGYGGMTLSVKGGTSSADQREAWYQARKKLDDLRLELPEGVIGPIVNDEYGDVYSLMYAVKGDGISHAELSNAAEDIKLGMLKVPMVKKVDLVGEQAKRVYVEFSNERLATLGITPLAIAESLKSQNAMQPAGQIDTQGDRVMVRVSGQFASLDDIRNVPVTAGGRTLKLGDIATVARGYEDPPSYTVRHNGQPVLMLAVSMTGDGNVVALGKAMEKQVAKIQSELPHGVELELVADQPTTVKDAVWDFERSLMEALVIVIAVSLASLGWRAGLVVATSVPLVLGGVAVMMLAMGWNLERISLGSLIIALGLLVDDSIIAIEMMVAKMEVGWDRVKAAAFSYSSTAMPRLTGALITAAGFMPVGLSKSTTGEYAGGIFWIVGAAVLLSWLCSGIFTPYLAAKLLPANLGRHGHAHDPYGGKFYRRLRGLIDLAIERRWLVIGITACALVLALAGMKAVPQQFFPNSSRPELLIDLRLKEGASFQATTEQVKRMEAVLAKDQDVKFFTAYTGAGAPRFYLAQPRAAEPGLRAVRRDDEGPGGARAPALEVDGQRRRAVPAGLDPRHPSRDGSRRRLPGAVPRRRPRQADGARHRPQRGARRGLEPESARHAARLERPGARVEGGSRPGQGARARPHAGRRLAGDPERDERGDAVAASRAPGPDRHRGPRGARGAPEPGHPEERQPLHPPGHGGAAVGGGQRALRARGARAVAPQPRHGDHRAGRRGRRRAGGVGDAGDPPAAQ
jgi:multidrug efflux pump subunit AcrB